VGKLFGSGQPQNHREQKKKRSQTKKVMRWAFAMAMGWRMKSEAANTRPGPTGGGRHVQTKHSALPPRRAAVEAKVKAGRMGVDRLDGRCLFKWENGRKGGDRGGEPPSSATSRPIALPTFKKKEVRMAKIWWIESYQNWMEASDSLGGTVCSLDGRKDRCQSNFLRRKNNKGGIRPAALKKGLFLGGGGEEYNNRKK